MGHVATRLQSEVEWNVLTLCLSSFTTHTGNIIISAYEKLSVSLFIAMLLLKQNT